MQWSHRLVCWTPCWCGLCLSLKPQPGHCVGSLGKDSLAPYIPLPGVQMSTNERLGKPDNKDECQISWRESSFYPFSLFQFLSGKRERTAPKFWFCAHKISRNQLNISGTVSSRFTFLGSELLLFIVSFRYLSFMSFTFFKESVHNGGIQRRVGCD